MAKLIVRNVENRLTYPLVVPVPGAKPAVFPPGRTDGVDPGVVDALLGHRFTKALLDRGDLRVH